MQPKVSIILPTFNRDKVLQRAIDSVISQDYSNIELIIVDDGSVDDTDKILKRLENKIRIKIVKHKHNLGVTAAKNTGLNNLPRDTKYFGIFDSDDVLVSDAITLLVNTFEKLGSSVSQVFGWCADLHSKEPTGLFSGKGCYITYEDALCGRFSGEFWQVVRMDLLGKLRFEERACGGEAIVWHSLLKKAPAYLISNIVRYYDSSCKDRISINFYDQLNSNRRMWINFAYLNIFSEDLRRLCPTRYALFALETAKWAILAGKRILSIRLLFKTFTCAPLSRWLNILLQTLLPVKLLKYLHEKKDKVK